MLHVSLLLIDVSVEDFAKTSNIWVVCRLTLNFKNLNEMSNCEISWTRVHSSFTALCGDEEEKSKNETSFLINCGWKRRRRVGKLITINEVAKIKSFNLPEPSWFEIVSKELNRWQITLKMTPSSHSVNWRWWMWSEINYLETFFEAATLSRSMRSTTSREWKLYDEFPSWVASRVVYTFNHSWKEVLMKSL